MKFHQYNHVNLIAILRFQDIGEFHVPGCVPSARFRRVVVVNDILEFVLADCSAGLFYNLFRQTDIFLCLIST